MDVDWENVCQASVSTHFVDLACLLDRRVCISVDMVRPIFLFLIEHRPSKTAVLCWFNVTGETSRVVFRNRRFLMCFIVLRPRKMLIRTQIKKNLCENYRVTLKIKNSDNSDRRYLK